MSVTKLLSGILLALLLVAGCDNNDDNSVNPVPATPQGVYSVTGDNAVTVYFYGIYERDVEVYIIYRSLNETSGYQEIGQVAAQDNPNLDLIQYQFTDNNVANGTTYFYAVTAVDFAGQESDLSAENVFDTPRPEGIVNLFPNTINASLAGFDLVARQRVADTASVADVFIDEFEGIVYINARDAETDIQDMGYTEDFASVGYAPEIGWSELGYFEIILGHTYVIWTRDGNFAKMRVQSFNSNGSVTFQWAYQTDVGNPELAPVLPPTLQKPKHGADYLRKQAITETSSAR